MGIAGSTPATPPALPPRPPPLSGFSRSNDDGELLYGYLNVLKASKGPGILYTVEVTEKMVSIGRSYQAEIRVASNKASRIHSRIRIVGTLDGRVFATFEQVSARRGALVNGVIPLTSGQQFGLINGDSVQIMDVLIIWRACDQGQLMSYQKLPEYFTRKFNRNGITDYRANTIINYRAKTRQLALLAGQENFGEPEEAVMDQEGGGGGGLDGYQIQLELDLGLGLDGGEPRPGTSTSFLNMAVGDLVQKILQVQKEKGKPRPSQMVSFTEEEPSEDEDQQNMAVDASGEFGDSPPNIDLIVATEGDRKLSSSTRTTKKRGSYKRTGKRLTQRKGRKGTKTPQKKLTISPKQTHGGEYVGISTRARTSTAEPGELGTSGGALAVEIPGTSTGTVAGNSSATAATIEPGIIVKRPGPGRPRKTDATPTTRSSQQKTETSPKNLSVSPMTTRNRGYRGISTPGSAPTESGERESRAEEEESEEEDVIEIPGSSAGPPKTLSPMKTRGGGYRGILTPGSTPTAESGERESRAEEEESGSGNSMPQIQVEEEEPEPEDPSAPKPKRSRLTLTLRSSARR